jgi:predicted NUDIX family NTP pyrophosphohydrolase
MAKTSAGLLLYRRRAGALEVLLVHPGGPFWQKKQEGAWSIPKGEYTVGEDPLAVAQREFTEETGAVVAGPFAELGSIRQAGGKLVTAWAAEGDFDVTKLVSNTFEMEWPPRSKKTAAFPEVDEARWLRMEGARSFILKSQHPLLDRLLELLAR